VLPKACNGLKEILPLLEMVPIIVFNDFKATLLLLVMVRKHFMVPKQHYLHWCWF